LTGNSWLPGGQRLPRSSVGRPPISSGIEFMTRPDKDLADAVLRRAEACLALPIKVTAPILQPTDSGGLVFVASAVLLDAGEHAFALTASHVLDLENSGELLLGRIGGDAVSLRGPKALTKIPHGRTRDHDHVDLAMVHLTESARSSFKPEEFIKVSQLHLGPPPAGDFILAGYPITHQPRRLAPGDDFARLYGLLADEVPLISYERDGYDRQISLLLGFNKKETWRLGVGRATGPDLHGVSGGGIWHLGDVNSPTVTPRLCAIGVEWHRDKYKRILATRVRVAIEEIARRFPELALGLED